MYTAVGMLICLKYSKKTNTVFCIEGKPNPLYDGFSAFFLNYLTRNIKNLLEKSNK